MTGWSIEPLLAKLKVKAASTFKMWVLPGNGYSKIDPWPDFIHKAFTRLNMDVYLILWGPSEFTVSGKLKNLDLSSQLSQITEPVLLTCGDCDEAGVKTIKDFQMSFPNAHMAVLPNATHVHHIEQSEIYKQIVNTFLNRNILR